MIRQAISCDVCGTEKKQTNHWFVAYEQGGELRVSGWSSRNRLRAGSKHLCGQACLHKLADDFMERLIAVRPQQPVGLEELEAEMPEPVDTSLTTATALAEMESSARLIAAPAPPAPPAPPLPMALPRPAAALVTMPEPSRYASRNWRAEAWERERERTLRADRRPEAFARRVNEA